MTAKINEIEYSIHNEGSDIILIPVMDDDHTLVLHGGYERVLSEAFNQAKTLSQMYEIAADLMSDYVLDNQEELIRVDA